MADKKNTNKMNQLRSFKIKDMNMNMNLNFGSSFTTLNDGPGPGPDPRGYELIIYLAKKNDIDDKHDIVVQEQTSFNNGLSSTFFSYVNDSDPNNILNKINLYFNKDPLFIYIYEYNIRRITIVGTDGFNKFSVLTYYGNAGKQFTPHPNSPALFEYSNFIDELKKISPYKTDDDDPYGAFNNGWEIFDTEKVFSKKIKLYVSRIGLTGQTPGSELKQYTVRNRPFLFN